MEFCSDCNSLLYTKHIGDGDSKNLSYYCKLCNKQMGTILEKKNHTIYSSEYQKDNLTKTNAIIKYAKYDYTLPRLNIDCNSDECKKYREENKENKEGEEKPINKPYDKCIIYIRYNNANLSHIYLCPICNNTWKNKSN